MKRVQKNIVIHTNVTINEHIKTPSKVRTTVSAFLPSGDTTIYKYTKSSDGPNYKDILDCRQETTKRADRLHMSSEKDNVLSNKGTKLFCVSDRSFRTLLAGFLQAVRTKLANVTVIYRP